MFGHYKKSASVLTDQEMQMVDNDRWPATICNTGRVLCKILYRKRPNLESIVVIHGRV